MKKINFCMSILAAAAMGLTFSACSNDIEGLDGATVAKAPVLITGEAVPTAQLGFGYNEAIWYAGQHIEAGKVVAYNDYENFYVTCTTQDGWEIKDFHLFVGDKNVLLDPANGYVNKNGSPKNGQFPVSETFDPRVTTVTYTFPLSEVLGVEVPDFGGDAAAAYAWWQENMETLYCPVVAAHGALVKPVLDEEGNPVLDEEGNPVYEEETAWGNGTPFVRSEDGKKGNWSMFVEGNCVEFPEPVVEPEPEIVFGYTEGETGWACILDDEWDFASKNWADFFPYTEGETKTVTIYAGNPKNDAENKVAGTIVVAPAEEEGYVTVTVNVETEECVENEGKWFLNPAKDHNVMINYYDEDPTNETTAPGQFPIKAHGEYVFTAPVAKFYAVHLCVAQLTVTEVVPEVEVAE